jgi:hypothetical protein
MVTSPPVSPSPFLERGKMILKEGLTPLLNTPLKQGFGDRTSLSPTPKKKLIEVSLLPGGWVGRETTF